MNDKFVRKNSKFVVYKITHVDSGKSYIGITMDYKRRLKQHFGCKDKTYFYNAIHKYGKENFNHEIICRCNCWEDLCEKEVEYIKLLNTKAPNGYNLTEGGNGVIGHEHSAKIRKKMSESHKGTKHSDKTRKKISESHKGKRFSKEHKQKLSEIGKNRIFSEVTRKKISKANTNPSKKTRGMLSNATKGKNNPFYGKKHTNESLKKMSDSSSIFSNDQILKIRQLLLDNVSQYKIAGKFNTSQPTISDIKTNKTYPEIQLPDKEIMEYNEFLKSKQIKDQPSGFKVGIDDLNSLLFDWQKSIVKWALARGRAAIFAECGLGKTPMQLEFANQVCQREQKPILILAPLAVSGQTVREGTKFGIKVNICESQKDVVDGINITNYEKLSKFDVSKFVGIVLDESSILKNYSGSIKNQIINATRDIQYRLACSATPAPNDHIELCNHAEFLGVMNRAETLATFFINDTANTGTWRLKGHIKDNMFWEWMASWAVMITKPSDIGFKDGAFKLPKIHYHQHIIKTKEKSSFGFFTEVAQTLNERRKARKDTIEIRCEKAAELINKTDDKWAIWCGLNAESEMLTRLIEDSKEVAGKHSDKVKTTRMIDFANGKLKRIVTKPKIAGLGMNWQVCNNAVFVGLSDSWEAFYQAVRRIWRFGQNKEVNIHIIIEEREGAVLKNIQRKDEQAKNMIQNIANYMKEITKQQPQSTKKETIGYNPINKMELPKWI